MTTNHDDKPTRKEQDTKAMNGVDLHLGTVGTLILGGATFTPATLKAVFQADIDAMDETDAARTALKAKVAAARAVRKRTTGVRKDLKAFLVGQNGAGAVTILEDFGFDPPKTPGPKKAKTKADAQAKAGATRSRKKAALEAAAEPQPAASPVAPQPTPPAAPANPATK